MANLTKLSRFLSLMLRHRADDFGLTLDSEGFTDIDAVWAQVEKRFGKGFTQADLDTLLTENEAGKQRFEQRGEQIRALYGHSKVTEIEYEPAEPPEFLYHGTVDKALSAIRKQGLTGQKRQYVHLSTNTERATDVAGRRGEPILLRIKAKIAHDAGIVFYHPEPKHYLVKTLAPEYIEFPEPEDEG